MWDLPRPGLEPVSPALAGRFLTTAPPRKLELVYLLDVVRRLEFKSHLCGTLGNLLTLPCLLAFVFEMEIILFIVHKNIA